MRRIQNAEATSHPWWLIIDPSQMMRPSAHAVANMITGPFLSRESAQAHLDGRRYAFGRAAVVYCHTGCWSREWKALCMEEITPTEEEE